MMYILYQVALDITSIILFSMTSQLILHLSLTGQKPGFIVAESTLKSTLIPSVGFLNAGPCDKHRVETRVERYISIG